MPGMMYVEFGYVEGPTIKTQTDYLVLLHELGHFALGHTQGRPPKTEHKHYFDNGVLRSEAQAWEFALDHRKEVLGTKTKNYILNTSLRSYYLSYLHAEGRFDRLTNGNRHHVEFIWDTPDKYFWSICKRVQES